MRYERKLMMIKPVKSISIKKYMRLHENIVLEALEESTDLERLEKEHMKQIQFMQHERLVHLMVLCLTTVLLITGVILMFCITYLPLYLLTLIICILEMFYLIHYFRLENTVQRWYILDQNIQQKIHESV